MGLDTLELVLAFEDEFGVKIDNAAAEKMRTPRDVVDYIATFCDGRERCTSRSGFYQLRRHFIEQHGTDRAMVRPETLLVQLLPVKEIRTAWTGLETALSVEGRKWPQLEYPAVFRYGIFISSMTLLFGLPIIIARMTVVEMFPYALILGGLSAFWLWKIFDKLMMHHRVIIPDSVATTGMLIKTVIPGDWAKSGNAITAWGRACIARRVKAIVIQQLGVSESDYHEDARFIEDFGAD